MIAGKQAQWAKRLALILTLGALTLVAISLRENRDSNTANPVRVELMGSQRQSKAPAPSISDQVAEAQRMFDESEPPPSSSGLGPGPSAPRAGAPGGQLRGTASLGLKGMTQREFESKVVLDVQPAVRRAITIALFAGNSQERSLKPLLHQVRGEVTKKVAAVLVKTMRPLKRILKEQQVKIDQLRKQKQHLKQEEKLMASREASKLKDGLLSHLKRDVDSEVKTDLTPKVMLKAEKSKAKLKKKLEALKKQHHEEHHRLSAHHTDESAKKEHKESSHRASSGHEDHAQHSHPHIPSPLDKHSHPRVEIPHESKHKKKCDPLAGLYKTGLVSWC